MSKQVLHSVKHTLAVFIVFVMLLSLMPTVTLADAPNIVRSNPETKINNSTIASGWETAQITLDSANTGGTGIKVGSFSSVGNITTIPIVAIETTATIPWYTSTNMIGFNVTVPNDYTWLVDAKLTLKDADENALVTDRPVTKIAGVTNLDNRQDVNYAFSANIPGEGGVNFTKGGLIHLYTRPNEARIWEYTLTWAADDASSASETDRLTETIIIDMSSDTLELQAPVAPSDPGAIAGALTALDINGTIEANTDKVRLYDIEELSTGENFKYDLYTWGGLTDLKFNFGEKTNVAYKINGGVAVVAENTTNGIVTVEGTLQDRDQILFYSSANDYFIVRVYEVARMTVNVGENGSVDVDFSEVANITGAETDADEDYVITVTEDRSWLRDLNDVVTFTVTANEYYEIDTVTLTIDGGEPEDVELGGDGINEFQITFDTAAQYTINVTFIETELDESVDVETAGELKSALENAEINIINIITNIITDENLAVSVEKTLNISDDTTLTIDSGNTLTVDGTLALGENAKILIKGTLALSTDANLTADTGAGFVFDGGMIKFVSSVEIESFMMFTSLDSSNYSTDISAILNMLLSIPTSGSGSIIIADDQYGEIEGDKTLNDGATLEVQNGGALVVADGASLTISGDASVVIEDDAEAEIEGSLTVNGELIINGDLTVANGADVIISGTITAGSTAIIDLQTDITVGIGGSIDLSAADSVTIGNITITLEPGATLIIPDDTNTTNLNVIDFDGNPISGDGYGGYTADSYALSLSEEGAGGVGYKRTITISGGNTTSKYILIKTTYGTAENAVITLTLEELTGVNTKVISYQNAGTTVELTLYNGEPDLTAINEGVATLAVYPNI